MLSIYTDKGGRSERDKLDSRRSTELTIPPISDSRPLVYHSDHHALSTSRFRRAGQLATADTCMNSLLTQSLTKSSSHIQV